MPNIASRQHQVVGGGKAVHDQDVAGVEAAPKPGRHKYLAVGDSSETIGNDGFISDGPELFLIHSERPTYYLYHNWVLLALDSSFDDTAILSYAQNPS